MARNRLTGGVSAPPRSHGFTFTSPLVGAPELHVSVMAYGEYREAGGTGGGELRVSVTRWHESDAAELAPDVRVEIEGADAVRSAEQGPALVSVVFTSASAARAAAALLVAATAEAERRGLLVDAPAEVAP